MKKLLILAVLTLTFATSAFATQSLELTLKAEGKLTLKKMSDTMFVKISENVTGNLVVIFNADGKANQLIDQALNTNNTNKDLSFEITGKNILRVIDQKEKIDQEVQSTINRSSVGELKHIEISSDKMAALYAESFKKAGLDTLSNLNINIDNSRVESKIKSSALSCAVDGDLLICTQSQELYFLISEK